MRHRRLFASEIGAHIRNAMNAARKLNLYLIEVRHLVVSTIQHNVEVIMLSRRWTAFKMDNHRAPLFSYSRKLSPMNFLG